MKLASIVVVMAAAVVIATGLSAHASKEKFERNKPHVNVGTIGHVDHSQTSGGQTSTTPPRTGTIGHTIGLPHEHQNPD